MCIKILLFSVILIVASCGNIIDRPVDLGSGYKLIVNGVDDLGIVDNRDVYVIYGHILAYNVDSNFIIAAERPRDSVPECLGLPLKQMDEVFFASEFKQFWIISKLNREKWGPFKYQDYLQMRNEIGVPESLKLSFDE